MPLNKFYALVTKELRELLTFYMLVPLILTVAIFGVLGKIINKAKVQANNPQPIIVVDNDRSALSKSIITTLGQVNFKVESHGSESVAAAKTQANANKSVAIMVIPSGLAISLTKADAQPIQLYALARNFSVTGSENQAVLKSAIDSVNQVLSDQTIKQAIPGIDPNIIKTPIKTDQYTIVGDRQAHVSFTDVLGVVSQQIYFIPIILFIVIVFATQMVATSIATEKENKTLETLLSAPVSRQLIVTAKLLAAGIVAALFALVYMFGFRYYMSGLTGASTTVTPALSQAINTLGLTFTPTAYILLGLSLFFAILCALAIALILGGFAEDVKSVQGIVTPIVLLTAIPYFLVMFLDFSSLSPAIHWLVYAIPFSHPFLAAQDIWLHQYAPIIYGIGYEIIIFIIFVMIASKIFSSDYIVTMKLNFSRKRS